MVLYRFVILAGGLTAGHVTHWAALGTPTRMQEKDGMRYQNGLLVSGGILEGQDARKATIYPGCLGPKSERVRKGGGFGPVRVEVQT